MDLAHGNRPKKGFRVNELNSIRSGLYSDPLLVIKLSDSRVLQIMSRSFFLAIVLFALPSIGPFMSSSPNATNESGMDFDLATLEMLPFIFPDLFNEGLVRRGHKGQIVGSFMGDMRKDLEFLGENGIDLDIVSNLDEIPNEALDFVFGLHFKSIKSVDRVLKANGIVITQMNNVPLFLLLQQHPNYRIVYVRRFQSTIVAMRKDSFRDDLVSSTGKLRLCGMTQEGRKVALKGLEDALLEPPRGVLLKSMNDRGQINFLPDLVGDSLEAYRRRIFISDDKNGDIEEWFYKNYPTRNQHFEMYNWDVEAYSSKKSSRIMGPSSVGISDWLKSNVGGEEDYVVMKAEEQVVEEMMKDKTICLVDELFLECKNQWQEEGEEHQSKRAYWQCLALYGNLRDEGIAVHQWWS